MADAARASTRTKPDKSSSISGQFVLAQHLSRPHCLPTHGAGNGTRLIRLEAAAGKGVVVLCLHDGDFIEVGQKKIAVDKVEASYTRAEVLLHGVFVEAGGGDEVLVALRAVAEEEQTFMGAVFSLVDDIGIAPGWHELFFPGRPNQPSFADIVPLIDVAVDNDSPGFESTFPIKARYDESWVLMFQLSEDLILKVLRGRKGVPVSIGDRIIPHLPPSKRLRDCAMGFQVWEGLTVYPKMVQTRVSLDAVDSNYRVPGPDDDGWRERLAIRLKEGWVEGFGPRVPPRQP